MSTYFNKENYDSSATLQYLELLCLETQPWGTRAQAWWRNDETTLGSTRIDQMSFHPICREDEKSGLHHFISTMMNWFKIVLSLFISSPDHIYPKLFMWYHFSSRSLLLGGEPPQLINQGLSIRGWHCPRSVNHSSMFLGCRSCQKLKPGGL